MGWIAFIVVSCGLDSIAVKWQMELDGEYRNVNYVDVGPEAVGPSLEEYVELEEYEEELYPKVTNKIAGREFRFSLMTSQESSYLPKEFLQRGKKNSIG